LGFAGFEAAASSGDLGLGFAGFEVVSLALDFAPSAVVAGVLAAAFVVAVFEVAVFEAGALESEAEFGLAFSATPAADLGCVGLSVGGFAAGLAAPAAAPAAPAATAEASVAPFVVTPPGSASAGLAA
jgi:hypothetical protein